MYLIHFAHQQLFPFRKDQTKYKYRKNYRGIALSSLLSKIFDNCIILLQESCLLTDDLQFTYKLKLLQYNAYLQLPR